MDRCVKVATIVFVVQCLGLVQADRQCYSCSQITCLRQTTFNATKTCSNSSDGCVTTFHSMGGIAFRGCSSELPETERNKCTGSSTDLCHQCSADLCNNVGPASSKCATCSSSSNRDCLQNPTRISPQPCPLSFAMQFTCYVDASNGVTVRGCASPKQEKSCLANPSLCYTCAATDTNCNQITYPANRTKCYTCEGANCRTPLATEFCDEAYDSCVAINLRGTQVKKCTKQRSSAENEFCRSYPRQCVECSGAQCNSADVADGETTPSNPTGTTPNSNATTSNPTGTTPNPNATTPNPTGTTSNPTGTTPNPTGTTPNPNATTPNPNATTPNPNSTAPLAAGYAPFVALLLAFAFCHGWNDAL